MIRNLIKQARAAGVVFCWSRDDPGRLQVIYSRGRPDQQIVEALRKHKAELLAYWRGISDKFSDE